MLVLCTSERPKCFFLFRPKPKPAETAIFLSGRNRYRNRKYFSVSAETEAENETTLIQIWMYLGNMQNFLATQKWPQKTNIVWFEYSFERNINFFKKLIWKSTENSQKKFQSFFPKAKILILYVSGSYRKESMFRPNPKPKGVFLFLQN